MPNIGGQNLNHPSYLRGQFHQRQWSLPSTSHPHFHDTKAHAKFVPYIAMHADISSAPSIHGGDHPPAGLEDRRSDPTEESDATLRNLSQMPV